MDGGQPRHITDTGSRSGLPLDLYRDSDPPGINQAFRCAFLHPREWLDNHRLRCNLAKKHHGPHLFEISRREYKIWPEEKIEMEHPELYF